MFSARSCCERREKAYACCIFSLATSRLRGPYQSSGHAESFLLPAIPRADRGRAPASCRQFRRPHVSLCSQNRQWLRGAPWLSRTGRRACNTEEACGLGLEVPEQAHSGLELVRMRYVLWPANQPGRGTCGTCHHAAGPQSIFSRGTPRGRTARFHFPSSRESRHGAPRSIVVPP
jgi:hypothetical protein